MKKIPTETLPQHIKTAKKILTDKSVFFGFIAENMPWAESDDVTMATDGIHLIFSSEKTKDIPCDEIAGIIVHEIEHVLNKHHMRLRDFGRQHLEIFNEAADMVINPIIREHGYKLPSWVLMPKNILDIDASVEQIASRMLGEQRKKQEKEKSQEKQPPSENNGNGSSNNNETEKSDSAGEKTPDESQSGKNNNSPSTSENNKSEEKQENTSSITDESQKEPDSSSEDANEKKNSESETPTDSENAEQAEKETVSQYVEIGGILEPMNNDGSPASYNDTRQLDEKIKDVVKKAAQVSETCNEKLPRSLRELIEEISYDKTEAAFIPALEAHFEGDMRGQLTFERLNRRYYAMNTIAPGESLVGLGNVTWAIDTSGSVTAQELAKNLPSVLDLLSRHMITQIRLIMCDDEIRRDEVISIYELEDAMKIKGRNGTRVAPVFDAIQQSSRRTDILIYSTDLQIMNSRWQEVKYPFEKTIWLTDNPTKKVPFGEIILI